MNIYQAERPTLNLRIYNQPGLADQVNEQFTRLGVDVYDLRDPELEDKPADALVEHIDQGDGYYAVIASQPGTYVPIESNQYVAVVGRHKPHTIGIAHLVKSFYGTQLESYQLTDMPMHLATTFAQRVHTKMFAGYVEQIS